MHNDVDHDMVRKLREEFWKFHRSTGQPEGPCSP